MTIFHGSVRLPKGRHVKFALGIAPSISGGNDIERYPWFITRGPKLKGRSIILRHWKSWCKKWSVQVILTKKNCRHQRSLMIYSITVVNPINHPQVITMALGESHINVWETEGGKSMQKRYHYQMGQMCLVCSSPWKPSTIVANLYMPKNQVDGSE